ncbi:LytR/AlgR family response regulator transcription factor [Flavobacterium sp.]|uniref:LytR/AlgR family response regulator transcription factor n=1 Tax=Flavobacterium sp. TaxID=239 RepID=UPI003F6A1871
MKINIASYQHNKNIEIQINEFICSSSHEVIFFSVNNFDDLKNIDNNKIIDIIIFEDYNNKIDIINFLREANQSLAKIIILSPNENDVFEYLKYNIFDYILISTDLNILLARINRAINKIHLERNFYSQKIVEEKFQKFIPVSSIKKIELVKVEDIVYFEADGRYTKLFLTNGVSKMASKNLGEFQSLIDPSIFCRIHHKFIINMNKLTNIIKADGYYCEMINNKNIPVSKRRIIDLNAFLNIGKNSL